MNHARRAETLTRAASRRRRLEGLDLQLAESLLQRRDLLVSTADVSRPIVQRLAIDDSADARVLLLLGDGVERLLAVALVPTDLRREQRCHPAQHQGLGQDNAQKESKRANSGCRASAKTRPWTPSGDQSTKESIHGEGHGCAAASDAPRAREGSRPEEARRRGPSGALGDLRSTARDRRDARFSSVSNYSVAQSLSSAVTISLRRAWGSAEGPRVAVRWRIAT